MSTTSELQKFEQGVQQLMLGITDKKKRKIISRRIATYLKNSYRERLKSQTDIHGKAFAPRAPVRSKSPYRLKQEKRKLLINFSKASSLRANYTADRLRVGYTGMAGKVARFQDQGTVQQRKNYFIQTPARKFTGINAKDWDQIESIIAEEM